MLSIILESFKKRKKKFSLIMIQFIVGFCALLFALSAVDHLMEYKRSVERLAPLDSIHLYMQTDDLPGPSAAQIQKYENILTEIQEEVALDRLGMFEELYVREINDNTINTKMSVLMMNQDMLNMFDFDFSQGDKNKLIDYCMNDQTIPIIISSSLTNTYEMGGLYDICFYDESQQKYRVQIVGVLKKSMGIWTGGSSMITDSIATGKDVMIAPVFNGFSSDIPYTCNMVLDFSSTEDLNETMEEIQSILAKEDLSAQYRTLNEEIQQYYSRQKTVVVATIVFAIIILLLSVLGCIGTILLSTLSRKKEFGIYFSLGCTMKHVMALAIGEISIIFITSFAVATIKSILLINFVVAGSEFHISFLVVGVSFFIMAICALLCTLVPLRYIGKMQPISLITERDN